MKSYIPNGKYSCHICVVKISDIQIEWINIKSISKCRTDKDLNRFDYKLTMKKHCPRLSTHNVSIITLSGEKPYAKVAIPSLQSPIFQPFVDLKLTIQPPDLAFKLVFRSYCLLKPLVMMCQWKPSVASFFWHLRHFEI